MIGFNVIAQLLKENSSDSFNPILQYKFSKYKREQNQINYKINLGKF